MIIYLFLPISSLNASRWTESRDFWAQEGGCGERVCKASVWHLTDPRLSFPTPHVLDPDEEEALLFAAKDFLDQYYASIKR